MSATADSVAAATEFSVDAYVVGSALVGRKMDQKCGFAALLNRAAEFAIRRAGN